MEYKSMESKPVSLSATQGTPPVLPSSQPQAFEPRKLALSSSVMLSSSLPIRAPVTMDDDGSDFESNDDKFENNTSTGSSLGGSESGSEYEVFVSGEEFETASERGLVGDPDEDTVEESGFADKYYRPFVAYPDEESVENEEETGENLKWVRPIAQLSWEDDASDLVGSEVEDEVSLSSIGVTNLGVVEKISIAPRVKLLEVDEGIVDESNQSENLDFDNFVEAQYSFPSTKEEKLRDVEDCVRDVLVEDISGGGAAVHEESLVADDKDVTEQNSESVADVKLLSVENHKFEEYDTERHTHTEDSSDAELHMEETDFIEGYSEGSHEHMGNNLVEKEELNLLRSNVDNRGAENNLKYAAEELLVSDGSNETSVDSSGGARLKEETNNEIPESNVDAKIDFGQAEDNSLAEFSVTNQSEEIVDFGEYDLSKTVDEYEEVGCDEDTIDEGHSAVFDEDAENLVRGNSELTKQTMSEPRQIFVATSHLGTKDSEDHSQDSDEGGRDSDGKVDGPTDFYSSPPSGKVASQHTHTNTSTPLDLRHGDEFEVNLSEEEKKKIEKMRLLRVNFLRLAHRLGISLEDSTITQVLAGLVLDVGKNTNHFGTPESTKKMALDFEAENKSNLDFSLNILVLGKSGVGKSATINFIFGEKKAVINSFKPATTALKEIVGTVDGVKIRILDTPGLKIPALEQAANQKMLAAIGKYIKKFPPDVVLYVDRLDTQSRDHDLPLLRSITTSLGPSIWKNVVVTLTHAASVPPDGPSGLPLSHEVFVAQKYRVVLQSISMAVGNMHLMNRNSVVPLALVENNTLLSEGSSRRSQLLLLCHSIKVLSEASSLSMLEIRLDQWKFVGFPIQPPLLHYLLSSQLQSHAHPNFAGSDAEFADLLDPESEDEDEYEQLPSFRTLNRSQLAKLSKEQRKNYVEEYDYRVKLLQRRQWKEEIKRLREIKKKGKDGTNMYHEFKEDGDREELNPSYESVPLPDMALPPSFDGEDSAYRYRSLEPSSQLLVRPVMETSCWDHDYGYNGVNLERDSAVSDWLPAAFSVQITKDKKRFNILLDSSVSMKHGENCSTLAGLDVQTIGKRIAYILRGETKLRNLRMNKTTAGLNVTFVGDDLATGFKIEDQIAIGKCLVLAASTGAVQCRGHTAYGANLEVRLKEMDYPIGQDQSSFGLSLMKVNGDLALTTALQGQFSIGRSSKMAVQIGLDRERSGRVTVRTSCRDQLQIALVGILPIIVAVFRSIYSGLGAQNSSR
ncbi:Chloroplast protein import component [Trema orientale]|uniref:Chloroplast protein import component n=1 Tax=Trema orientale TaxID=63057 RepID=A0A2P5ES67_TREOI|nr:Chloroplast protein import component [Trema orientale]